MLKRALLLPFLFVTVSFLSACQAVPKQTVELADVSDYQIAELQKSHIKFINLYYDQRRTEVDNFLRETWIPTFLAKAVENTKFRQQLDTSYSVSSLSVSDLNINITAADGSNLNAAQLAIVKEGITESVDGQRAKLGQTLIHFAEAAQKQIDKQRNTLMDPINAQQQLVVDEVNAAYADLQRANASIKAYLSSAVELKQEQDAALEKLGLLDKANNALNKVYDANDKISAAMEKGGLEVDDLEDKLNQALADTKQAFRGSPAPAAAPAPVPTDSRP